MEPSGKPPPHEIIAREVERFLRQLPLQTRRKLKQPSVYADEATRAFECARSNGSPRAMDLKRFVADHMSRVTFEKCLEPSQPLDDPWVLGEAARIAEQILRSRDRLFRPRYGDAIADDGAAQAIGYFGLVELGRRMWEGEKIENPHAYLRKTINGDVHKMVDAAMRAVSPGAHAHHRLVRKYLKEISLERPELDELGRLALATKQADVEIKRLGRFCRRVGDGDVESLADLSADIFQQTFDDLLIETTDELVADEELFTDTDRDTWARFKAAGLRGQDIDWEEDCSRQTGAQRLFSLLRKLADLLDDWRL